MSVDAILIKKEGEIYEIKPNIVLDEIYGFTIKTKYGNEYIERLFIKCPNGYCVNKTKHHSYEIYIDPYETEINNYVTGFNIDLKNKIYGDIIVIKRDAIYPHTIRSYNFDTFSNMFHLNRYIYKFSPGLTSPGFYRNPIKYWGGRRDIHGRYYLSSPHASFFEQYSPNYIIVKVRGGYVFRHRTQNLKYFLPETYFYPRRKRSLLWNVVRGIKRLRRKISIPRSRRRNPPIKKTRKRLLSPRRKKPIIRTRRRSLSPRKRKTYVRQRKSPRRKGLISRIRKSMTSPKRNRRKRK